MGAQSISNSEITYADIEFRTGQLYSRNFDDIYFAKDGPAETDRVFLNPAKVLERLQENQKFTIAELGFGTGLNFLQTCQRIVNEQVDCPVRYIAFEQYPVTNSVRRRATKPWSQTLQFLEQFCATSPPPVCGWHRRYFLDCRLELSLYFGPVEIGLEEFREQDVHGVDAWFLDGFKPETNADMWSPEMFQVIRELTKPRGTVTSFSVAGNTRRGLIKEGFEVSLVDNAPYKRHTLLATIKDSSFSKPALPREATVVGGGFAGTAAAFSLAQKGVHVDLYEKNEHVGSQTSSIPVAIQHARLSTPSATDANYRVHAYSYATSLFHNRKCAVRLGALQLSGKNLSTERLTAIASYLGPEWCDVLNPDEVLNLLGQSFEETCAWFPRSRVVLGRSFCEELADHPSIVVHNEHFDLSADFDRPTIIAVGSAVEQLDNVPPLESICLQGQVDTFESNLSVTGEMPVLLNDGYVVRRGSSVTAGSTYEYSKWHAGEATQRNQARARSIFPEAQQIPNSVFRGNRLVNSDRYPVVGHVKENVWYSLGHGSSGTISALYGGELIASQLTKSVLPGSSPALDLLDPWRFAKRQQRRPNPLLNRNWRNKPSG